MSLRCPSCKSEETFTLPMVPGTVRLTVDSDGNTTDEEVLSTEYDGGEPMTCDNCGHEGINGDFDEDATVYVPTTDTGQRERVRKETKG